MGESRRPIGTTLLVLVCLVLGFLGGVGGSYLMLRGIETAPMNSPAPAGNAYRPVARVTQIKTVNQQDAVVQATEKVNPAVVTVVATTLVRQFPEDFFFGPIPAQGMGSGFAFEFQGRKYVLTNTHVITLGTNQVAQDVTVILDGGQQIPAQVVGFNTDEIAVLQLAQTPPDLPVAVLGDSDSLRPGQTVIAIGNPFGFEHTVTTGVVSAVGPRVIQGHEFSEMIQTDAAINSGNSGGPLVDLGGNVVGMNTAIYSPTGASVGIGFAIPANLIKNSLPLLINKGPWLGIAVVKLTPSRARWFKLPVSEGVLVRSVISGGPADRAGIVPGDVIIAVNGTKVTKRDDLIGVTSKVRIGDTVNVTVVHTNGQQATVAVKASKIPEG